MGEGPRLKGPRVDGQTGSTANDSRRQRAALQCHRVNLCRPMPRGLYLESFATALRQGRAETRKNARRGPSVQATPRCRDAW